MQKIIGFFTNPLPNSGSLMKHLGENKIENLALRISDYATFFFGVTTVFTLIVFVDSIIRTSINIAVKKALDLVFGNVNALSYAVNPSIFNTKISLIAIPVFLGLTLVVIPVNRTLHNKFASY